MTTHYRKDAQVETDSFGNAWIDGDDVSGLLHAQLCYDRDDEFKVFVGEKSLLDVCLDIGWMPRVGLCEMHGCV